LRERGLDVRLARSSLVEADGRTPAGDGAFDETANATTLRRLLQQPCSAPEVIVGHGFGAAIAVALAAKSPRRTRALILVAPALRPAAIGALDRLLAARGLGPTLAWLGFRGAGLALRQSWLRRRLLVDRGGLSTEQAAEVVRGFERGDAWRVFAIEQRRLVCDARRFHRLLGEIHCPTFVIAGRDDRIASWASVCALAERLRGSRLIATDTGHLIPIEDPAAVLNAVLRAHGLPPLADHHHPTRSSN